MLHREQVCVCVCVCIPRRSLSTLEVERAKRTALATISNALESKATSAEDIGRQFLTYGRRISGKEYGDMIQVRYRHTDTHTHIYTHTHTHRHTIVKAPAYTP